MKQNVWEVVENITSFSELTNKQPAIKLLQFNDEIKRKSQLKKTLKIDRVGGQWRFYVVEEGDLEEVGSAYWFIELDYIPICSGHRSAERTRVGR